MRLSVPSAVRLAVPVLCAALLAAPPVRAQPSEQGAADLHAHLQDRIDRLLTLIDPEAVLAGRERLTVAVEGDAYRLDLTAAALRIPGRLSVLPGPIRAHLTPQPDGRLAGSVQLPPRVTVSAAAGGEGTGAGAGAGQGEEPRRLRLTVADPRLDLVYDPEHAALMSAETVLDDVRLESLHLSALRRADRVTFSRDSEPRDDGRWDVTTLLRVEGATSDHPRDGERRFSRLDLRTVLSGLDHGRLALVEDRLAATLTAARSDGRHRSDGLRDALLPLLIEQWETADGASLSLQLDDLAIVDREISPDGAPITLDRLGLTVGLTGMLRERAALTVGVELGGAGAPDVPETYLPEQFVLNVSVANLPTEPLRALLADLAAADGQGDAVDLLRARLPGSPLAEEAVLTLNDIRLALPTFTLAMTGTVRAESEALVGLVGDGYMEVGGLPELIAEMRALRMDDKIVAFLTILQAMGTRDQDAEGRAVRTYSIRATETGQVLVNNTDLLPMIQRAL